MFFDVRVPKNCSPINHDNQDAAFFHETHILTLDTELINNTSYELDKKKNS